MTTDRAGPPLPPPDGHAPGLPRPLATNRARHQLDTLAREHPEWRPLLALWAAVIDSALDPAWQAIRVDASPARAPHAPALAGATILLPSGLATPWLRRLLAAADLAPPPADLDAVALLDATINGDGARLASLATAHDPSPESLAAVAQVAIVPILRATARQAPPRPDPWPHGSCPTCGAWPTIAEHRGLERDRRLRCLRCAADWGIRPFQCPFCAAADHHRTGALVSDTDGDARRVETCAACRGYVKTITTLRPFSPDEIALADLATVALDLAALERGYERPTTLGYDLRARITPVAP